MQLHSSGGGVSIEENKTVVRRVIAESINANRPDLLGHFVAEDVRVHPGTPGTAPDTAGLTDVQTASTAIHAAFSDLRVTLDELFGEGELIAARWTATGTHAQEWAGVPASDRLVRWSGIDIYRFAEGKIAEWWRNDDSMWLFTQLRSEDRARR